MSGPLGPTLETARLVLRPPEAGDLGPWAEMMADPEAARYIGGLQPPSVCWRALMTMAGAWALDGFAMFSVIEKETGAWVGRLGPWRPHAWPGNEIGYGLIRQAWGKGYATEGCAAAIDWVVDHLGWTDIIHCIDRHNLASQAVAKRLGSTLRGPCKMPAPYENETTEMWGQTAAEWKARRG